MADESTGTNSEDTAATPPPIPTPETDQPRIAATVLALLIGLAGVVGICFFVHWHEVVMWAPQSQPQIIVNALAPGIFFLFILLIAVVNPLIRLLAPPLALKRRQTVLIFLLWMLTGVICYVNGFLPVLHTVGAVYDNAHQRPMMKRTDFRSYMNPDLFLNVRQDGDEIDEAATAEVTKNYYYGKGSGLSRIRVDVVPWGLWTGPLRYWVPFMVLMVVFSAALVRMMHRQWSKHELLTYPIAEFVDSMVSVRKSRTLPDVFYNKFFWIGFGLIGLVWLINGMKNWFPQMVAIPVSYNHYKLVRTFPFLEKYCGREAYSLFRATLYPTAIALFVLLPSEISLTGWLGWVLMIVGTGVYFLFTGEVIGVAESGYIQTGMYVAMLAMILYIGRREYARILALAVTMRRPKDRTLWSAVWACRVAIVSFLALLGLLIHAGMHWFIALVLLACFAMIVILIARMTAEMGFPWLVNFGGDASSLPMRLFGSTAIGPKSLAVIAVVGAILDFQTTNSIAAQETTYGKLVEDRTPRRYRVGLNVVLLLGVFVAIGATTFFVLWNNYSFGARQERRLAGAITNHMEEASKEINRLRIEGSVDSAAEAGTMDKLKLASTKPGFTKFFFYGVVVIAFVTLMRLRFTWWPLHPLPLLLLNEWALSRLYFSFFVAWLIKIALVKIGGGKVFIKSKPFFIGVIAGQIVLTGFWIAVNIIYFRQTDTQPQQMIRFFGG